MNRGLRKKLENLPDRPGVYLMKDGAGDVVYVGKALSLKDRVGSYFHGTSPKKRLAADTRPAARHIPPETHDVGFIITNNENEAFILENNLIKKLRPRYNIRLRDDKTFLSIKVDVRHPFPSVMPVRRPRKDGALYFGPYTSAGAVRSTLKFLRTVAPLRICSDREFQNRSRPCIQYQIKRCPGPCGGLVTRKEYRRGLDSALRILRGRVEELRNDLLAGMEAASSRMEYEAAARIRDRIRDLESFSRSQKVDGIRFRDADILGYHREGKGTGLVVLFIRSGKLASSNSFSFSVDVGAEEMLSQFLLRYYGESRHIPDVIFLPFEIPDKAGIEDFLGSRGEGRGKIKIPRRGEAAKLVSMAIDNARLTLRASRGVKELAAGVAESLRSSLGLAKAPLRIEGVDLSNTSGGEAVGSVVHFREGEPLKSRYRRYRIKTVGGSDDYAMMHEVVLRRLKRGKVEGRLPDLLLVDGGAGHVAAALRALRESKAHNIDIAGMAKRGIRTRATLSKKGEGDRVYIPNRKKPVTLPPGSDELHLLQRVRDEAHRFAVSYHRRLREKRTLSSPLDGIAGLGPDRRRKLLSRFGGLRGLKRVSIDEIMVVDGIGPVLGKRVYRALRKDE